MLTDLKIKQLKAREKSYKIFDGRGLYIEVLPSSKKYWRLKYMFFGKEKRISLGLFPEVSLTEARTQRDNAKLQIKKGIDPSIAKKSLQISMNQSSETTFDVIAKEWHELNKSKWSPIFAQRLLERIDKNLFPAIGKIPINSLTPKDILYPLLKAQERGAIETSHRLLGYCSKIFRYAIANGIIDRDYTIGLKEALKPYTEKHRAALVDPQSVAALMRSIEGYKSATTVVKTALQIAPLVFVRPGELRKAEWVEIDLNKAEWNIPAQKMKMKENHLVPLSTQAINLLSDLKKITGDHKYVFPCPLSKERPMSENAILSALRRMGYDKTEMTPHGFRAMARTLLDEELGIRPDFIEHQLAHAVRDPNGRAYNRTKHLAERRQMMQTWADYLDRIKKEL